MLTAIRRGAVNSHFPVVTTYRLTLDKRNARSRCMFFTAAARLSASCFIASAISASCRSNLDCLVSTGAAFLPVIIGNLFY
jgi:hypothetical protein